MNETKLQHLIVDNQKYPLSLSQKPKEFFD